MYQGNRKINRFNKYNLIWKEYKYLTVQYAYWYYIFMDKSSGALRAAARYDDQGEKVFHSVIVGDQNVLRGIMESGRCFIRFFFQNIVFESVWYDVERFLKINYYERAPYEFFWNSINFVRNNFSWLFAEEMARDKNHKIWGFIRECWKNSSKWDTFLQSFPECL